MSSPLSVHSTEWAIGPASLDLSSSPVSNVDNLVWQHPSTDMIKCKIDGAIFQNSNSVGVGMMLLNDISSFVAARSNYFNGLRSIREVEMTHLVETIH